MAVVDTVANVACDISKKKTYHRLNISTNTYTKNLWKMLIYVTTNLPTVGTAVSYAILTFAYVT